MDYRGNFYIRPTKLIDSYQDRIVGLGYLLIHYENTPMQHTAIFHGRKNDNFHLKCFDYFLSFAQNIDCGYTLEPPQ